ncbi:MAG: transporter substrate-binding domain-containing protein, partial [Nocardioidaceae bacterium]
MSTRTAKLLAIPALAFTLVLAGCTSDSSGGGGSTSPGNSQLAKVIKRGTVRVAVLPDFPPWSVQKSDGKFEGYEIDVAKDLADALGVKLKLVSTDGDSRLPLLKTDRVDVNIS